MEMGMGVGEGTEEWREEKKCIATYTFNGTKK